MNITLSPHYCWERYEGAPITIMDSPASFKYIYGIMGMIVAIPTTLYPQIVKFLANLYDNHKEAQQQRRVWRILVL